MPRYLSSNEGVSGKSSGGGGGRKGNKSSSSAGRRRNPSKDGASAANNGRPKSAGGIADETASNFGNFDDDAQSVMSRVSVQGSNDDDMGSVAGESVIGGGGEITEDQWAALEEKLKENIDNATHKNTNIRTPALKSMEKILSSHYVPDLLENQKLTISDCIEKLLRKGHDSRTAVKLVSLLVLQMGSGCADAVTDIVSMLKTLVNDPALSPDLRADCAYALGVCVAITEEEPENIINAAECLRTAWGHVKLHSATPEVAPYFSAAVSAWTFVLLQAPNKHLKQTFESELPKLAAYLESSQLEIRIAAGEAVALLYELANDMSSDDFRPPTHQHTLEMLERMSTESTKHTAKKDRRLQRASFRDIYAAVKSNDAPTLTIKLQAEILSIDTWSSKLCYDIYCQVLSGGINVHLKENPILRDTFNLGPPLPSGSSFKRLSKSERLTIVNTVSKARTLIRGKQRDKRMMAF